MNVDVTHYEDQYRDIGNAEQDVRDLLRLFADWIYGQLESEYEHRISDETVDEEIKMNEYEFTEEGKIV